MTFRLIARKCVSLNMEGARGDVPGLAMAWQDDQGFEEGFGEVQ